MGLVEWPYERRGGRTCMASEPSKSGRGNQRQSEERVVSNLHGVGAIEVGERPALVVHAFGRSPVRGSAHFVTSEGIRTREARELVEQRRAARELNDEPDVQHEAGRVTDEER